MSQSRMGKKNPNFGRVFTEEQRLNMSKAHLGKVRIQTEEEKLKRSNTMKEKWATIMAAKKKEKVIIFEGEDKFVAPSEAD